MSTNKNNVMVISEDQFDEVYKPIHNHIDDSAGWDGTLFETFGAELVYVTEMYEKSNHNVWTLVEGDNETMTIQAGMRVVNRMGFFITEKGWDLGDEIVNVDTELDGNMSLKDAQTILFEALSAYIQDSAGTETEEANEIQKAWDIVKAKINK